ncbi:DHHC palmitoyltransferase-domain-containing protein [Pterulicium gracile]|uniref:Palmitoyltransferase n=1 Tax=Pterulicium gracile TaxID=1884261 RepID=A0A5C3QZ88_9AGAR|nr:DHHC palmitoyltransferase-domain-containing protein [Pterula gracilis]
MLTFFGAAFWLVNCAIAPVISCAGLLIQSAYCTGGSSSAEQAGLKLLKWGYLLFANCALGLTLSLYLHLISGRTTRNVAQATAPNTKDLQEPYECADLAGSLAYCHKDPCNGAWKPPRAHHCSTCGVCRLGFDHHCPWLGNCVTDQDMKSFLTFLLSAPVALVICVFPIFRVLYRHCAKALLASQSDAVVRSMWWDRWYSWLFGGPLGRHGIGFALGFRAMRRGRDSSMIGRGLILQPRLRIAWLCWLGAVLSFFCVVLAVMTARSYLRGLSTLDTLGSEAAAKILVCFPSATAHTEFPSKVLQNTTGYRPYDLGLKGNWRRLRHQYLFKGPPCSRSSHSFHWPEFNPEMLRQLRKTVNGKEA